MSSFLARVKNRRRFLACIGAGMLALAGFQPPLDALMDAIGMHPGGPEARARALNTEGRYQEALVPLHRALRETPQSPFLHYALGIAYGGLDRHREKIAALREALRLDESHAAAHFKLALALAALGRHQEAILHYQRTLELRETDAAAAYFLGLSYHLTHRYIEADHSLKKASLLQPQAPEAFYALGINAMEMERYEEGMTHIGEALKRDGGYITRLRNNPAPGPRIPQTLEGDTTGPRRPREKGFPAGDSGVQETRLEKK